AGAKAPAITIPNQQSIAGIGGLMSSDDRCGAVHPTLGIRCDRKEKDCWGIDHTATHEDRRGEFWPNPEGQTPMHRYFADWVAAKQKVTAESEKENMESTNEDGSAQAQQPPSKPACPTCSAQLEPQQREPLVFWCANCRKWFYGDLKKL